MATLVASVRRKEVLHVIDTRSGARKGAIGDCG
jgi:hypothetical protein